VVVVVGLTIKLLPVPANVPPQDPVYHFITSTVPPPPPFSVMVELCPLQIVEGTADAEVGSADFWSTVTVTFAHCVLKLHGAGSS
jgi:hypothetical protein